MKGNGTPLGRNGRQHTNTHCRIKLLLVDDHQALLDLLKYYLTTMPEFAVVATAMDGLSALAAALRTRPDILLMDVNLPGLTGVQATQRLLRDHPCAGVIGLSVYHDRETVAAMIRAGARGFVPKSAAAEELIQAVKTVSYGGMYWSPKISPLVPPEHELNLPHLEASPALLTDQERRVAAHVADGLSSKEIAQELGIAFRTVEKHREMLGKKLHVSSVARLPKWAICHGLASLD